MTVGANSYGTAADVAALTNRWTSSGSYTTTTRPTLANVESWIDQISATLNISLAGAGFSIPVTNADAKLALAAVVIAAAADLCHAANSSGRFFTDRALERGVSPIRVIRQEMAAWVEDQADGLEMLGATRTQSLTGGIMVRETDERGNETFPIFQRDGFSNSFTNWDSE